MRTYCYIFLLSVSIFITGCKKDEGYNLGKYPNYAYNYFYFNQSQNFISWVFKKREVSLLNTFGLSHFHKDRFSVVTGNKTMNREEKIKNINHKIDFTFLGKP